MKPTSRQSVPTIAWNMLSSAAIDFIFFVLLRMASFRRERYFASSIWGWRFMISRSSFRFFSFC